MDKKKIKYDTIDIYIYISKYDGCMKIKYNSRWKKTFLQIA